MTYEILLKYIGAGAVTWADVKMMQTAQKILKKAKR